MKSHIEGGNNKSLNEVRGGMTHSCELIGFDFNKNYMQSNGNWNQELINAEGYVVVAV